MREGYTVHHLASRGRGRRWWRRRRWRWYWGCLWWWCTKQRCQSWGGEEIATTGAADYCFWCRGNWIQSRRHRYWRYLNARGVFTSSSDSDDMLAKWSVECLIHWKLRKLCYSPIFSFIATVPPLFSANCLGIHTYTHINDTIHESTLFTHATV